MRSERETVAEFGRAHVDAAAGQRLQHAARLQRLDCLANDRTADAERLGQIALRRQTVARLPGAILDHGQDPIHDAFVKALFTFQGFDFGEPCIHARYVRIVRSQLKTRGREGCMV